MNEIFEAAIAKAAINGSKKDTYNTTTKKEGLINGLVDFSKNRIVEVVGIDSHHPEPGLVHGEMTPSDHLPPVNGEGRGTPSPNMASIEQNLSLCQANIQQLLGSSEETQKKNEKSTASISVSEFSLSSSTSTQDTQQGLANGNEDLELIATPTETGKGKGKKRSAPRQKKPPGSPKVPKTPNTRRKKGKRKAGEEAADGPEAKTVSPAPITVPFSQQQVVQRFVPPPPVLRYMCEWNGCGQTFMKASTVYYHVATVHISDTTITCKWPHCDKTIRLRWSMTTHVQDVHCSEMALKSASLRRYEMQVSGQSNIPEPRTPPPHPGYSQNASIDAIRRHAFNNLQKELTAENEGPVTKSIRLTSCLILRNLARYSAVGRRILKRHERHLAWLALSQLESSTALAQCLAELNNVPGSPNASSGNR